ncbi:hypothetical protein MUK42_32246 [Musa troglodytarum]|uniref:Uncharacterized protein n=1 Tax=Musa troglodytarum TaxID=320322 RepID=A0A9E7I844_9LILI|nr:hypothetical protein MUK42_32246 [Musa troglodytarum]
MRSPARERAAGPGGPREPGSVLPGRDARGGRAGLLARVRLRRVMDGPTSSPGLLRGAHAARGWHHRLGVAGPAGPDADVRRGRPGTGAGGGEGRADGGEAGGGGRGGGREGCDVLL